MKTIMSLSYTVSTSAIILILGANPTVLLAQSDSKNDSSDTKLRQTDQHEHHDTFQERFGHNSLLWLKTKYALTSDNRVQIKDAINSYLVIKDALARDDAILSDLLAKAMQSKITNVDQAQMDGEGLGAWKQHSTLLLENLEHFQHMRNIEKKRSYFSHISEIVYCTVKSFNLDFVDLYSIYCRQAFSGKGAYWLSTTNEILNPYLGVQSEKCGDSVESLGTRKTLYISPFGRNK